MGREWVLQAVNDWLKEPKGARFFILTGDPGSGKSAISGRLWEFAGGIIPAPQDLETHRRRSRPGSFSTEACTLDMERPLPTGDKIDVVRKDRFGRFVVVEVDCGPSETAGPLQCRSTVDDELFVQAQRRRGP